MPPCPSPFLPRQRVGAKEFKFIEHSGAYFGFMFGLVQMIIYLFYKANWVLPVAGFFVGYATNYLALYVIFKPILPKKVCCFTFQVTPPTPPSPPLPLLTPSPNSAQRRLPLA